MRSTALLLFAALASSILPGFPLPMPVREVTLQSRVNSSDPQALAAASLPGNSGSSDKGKKRPDKGKKRPSDSSGGEPDTKKQATDPRTVVTFLNLLGEENTVGGQTLGTHDWRIKTALHGAIFINLLHEHVRLPSVEWVGSYKKRVPNPSTSDRNWNIFKVEWPEHPEKPVWFGWWAFGHDFQVDRPGLGNQYIALNDRTPVPRDTRQYIGIMQALPAHNGFDENHARGIQYQIQQPSGPALRVHTITPKVVERREAEWRTLVGEFNAMFMVPAGPPVQAHTNPQRRHEITAVPDPGLE